MSLLADLTYRHLEVESKVDDIRELLSTARDVRHNPEELYSYLIHLRPCALALYQFLESCFEYEKTELFPRARRILGSSLEEIPPLQDYQERILDRLSQFVGILPDFSMPAQQITAMKLAYWELLFEDFYKLYSAYCTLNRQFFENYSTILFPGGAMTD